jgi:hypothetical protein
MMKASRISGAVIGALLGAGWIAARSAVGQDHTPSGPITYEQLSQMEARANEARRLYWRGDYSGAVTVFEALSSPLNPSSPLYMNELGSCYLAAGDYPGAERSFGEAAGWIEGYIDPNREKKALSVFGKEEEKVYHGDPYEQSSLFLLLALLHMDRGDYDNALAACKNGNLACAAASENEFESNYTLLQLLQAKCLALRGDPDGFTKLRDAGANSYRLTSPEVRDAYAQRQEYLALLKQTAGERRQVGVRDSEDQLRTKLQQADEQLQSLSTKVDAVGGLGALYTGDYNTLIVVPRGRSPHKYRTGKDGQLVCFQPVSVVGPSCELLVDGASYAGSPIHNAADIEFQATTRGGRRMDAILKGKAAFRRTTVGVGSVLTQVGNAGGIYGLGFVLVGATMQGIGGAMTPEADTRCWQSLPKSYDVLALELPEGDHTFESRQFVYFEARGTIQRRIKLDGTNDMRVVILPPFPVGLYSDLFEEKMSLTEADTAAASDPKAVLIAPPLGLQRIERFGVEAGDKKPFAFAPDAKRVMRAVKHTLEGRGIASYLVTHDDLIGQRAQFAQKSGHALQLAVGDLLKQETPQGTACQAMFTISMIDTTTGAPIFAKGFQGACTEKKLSATDAFYKCLNDALTQFVSSTELVSALGTK